MHTDLSLILSTYNERPFLEAGFKRMSDLLEKHGVIYEVIIVDDGSTDGSLDAIRGIVSKNPNIAVRVISHGKNRGRGAAIRDGIEISKGEFVGFIDIDMEIDADSLVSSLSAAKKGYDVVIGMRIHKLSARGLPRFLITKTYARLARMLLRIPQKDLQAGLKIFRREKILPIIEKATDRRWFWDTQMVAYAYYEGLKIAEVPCLVHKNYGKASSVRIFRDSIIQLINLIKFSMKLRGAYGAKARDNFVK